MTSTITIHTQWPPITCKTLVPLMQYNKRKAGTGICLA